MTSINQHVFNITGEYPIEVAKSKVERLRKSWSCVGRHIPIQSIIGTFYLHNGNTTVEVYTYPDIGNPTNPWVIMVNPIILDKMDRIYFDDDIEKINSIQPLINKCLKNGFKMYL